jgi:aminoglycoside phosphotransferase
VIPEAKKGAVSRALQQAFGVGEFEDIQTLTAGLSPAHVYRVVVQGRPYLMRVVMDTGTAAGPGRGDQTNHYACMKLGANAGLGPRVWYTSIEDRVSITDFVEAQLFPRTEALARIPLTLRALHALPPFSKPKYTIGPDVLIRRFQDARILPGSETAELFDRYAAVTRVYPRDTEMVSCHNDLKPENILFDGDRVWLVDWEAAFLNDRYFDLAIVANFVVTNDAEEEAYLRTYFGEPAGEYRLARFYLMRQTMHMLATVVFMLIGSAGKPIEANAQAPAFREFHDGIWAGNISLASNEAKLQYARVHMNQLLENMRTARFDDALRIVAERHAGA